MRPTCGNGSGASICSSHRSRASESAASSVYTTSTGSPSGGMSSARWRRSLTRRGPDRTGIWHAGPIGLGHTLLATTPEMLLEDLPLEHPESGCVITGDIRLDNRDELLAAVSFAAGQA